MSKNTSDEFLKIPRALSDKSSYEMSGAAFKLYIALNEIEGRKHKNLMYDNGSGYYGFLCTDEEIRELTGMNEKTVQKAKKELKERGFINVSRGNWHYVASGKSDIKQPCKYFILEIESEYHKKR